MPSFSLSAEELDSHNLLEYTDLSPQFFAEYFYEISESNNV